MVCAPISHVGIALFNTPGYPTQWVLALSNCDLFQGRVYCTSLGLSVNGLQEHWVDCERSPASFNRTATFLGVIHVAMLARSMESVRSEFSAKGSLLVGGEDLAHTDRFVLGALKRIGERRLGNSSILLTKEEELGKAVRATIQALFRHQYPPGSNSFPVASLQMGGSCQVRQAKLSRS
jgi:hypothetical protein